MSAVSVYFGSVHTLLVKLPSSAALLQSLASHDSSEERVEQWADVFAGGGETNNMSPWWWILISII